LGRDHLLVIKKCFGREVYRRFFYKDIQHLIIQRNHHRFYKNACFTAFLTIGLLLGLHYDFFLWFSPLLCLPFIITTSLQGPHCSTHLGSEVQREKLVGLNTEKRALSFLKALQPLIEEKQGSWEPDMAMAVPKVAPAAPPKKTKAPPPKLNSYRGGFHLATYLSFFIAAACESALHFSDQTFAINLISIALVCITLFFYIFALIRQHHSRLSSKTKIATYISLGHWCIFSIAGMCSYQFFTFEELRQGNHSSFQQFDNYTQMLYISPKEHWVYEACSFVVIGSFILFGLIGLITFSSGPKQK
jgi:hypothetical protein